MGDLITFLGGVVVLFSFGKVCVATYRLWHDHKLGEWIRGERKWFE